jgi:hypothetical protein
LLNVNRQAKIENLKKQLMVRERERERERERGRGRGKERVDE